MNRELLKSIGCLSDERDYDTFVSTGSLALNHVISGRYDGGVPVGGITQFKGESSTAKTVFVISTLAQAQKSGYYTIFQDAEDSLNKSFVTGLGIDPSNLIYYRPETLEECFNDIHKKIDQIRAVDKETPIVVGVDSLPVLPIKAELDYKGYDEKKKKDEDRSNNSSPTLGAWRAKALGNELRLIYRRLKDDNVSLMVINQTRSKIGVMPHSNPDTNAAGGRSLEYYLSVDMTCLSNRTKKTLIVDVKTKKTLGITGAIKNKKNKVSTPFQECEFELYFDKGLTLDCGLINSLIQDEAVEIVSPGWYQCDGKKFRESQLLNLIDSGDLPTIKNLIYGK